VIVEDTRSPDLAVFMHEAHFSVQEAALSGGFVAMRTRLDELAQAMGVEVQVTVGSQRIYLVALTSDSYAYELVERVAPAGGGESR
jgi:hypothetical protein